MSNVVLYNNKCVYTHLSVSTPVTLTIQSTNNATLVYTPGSIGLAQPSPWLTMPATYHLFRLCGSRHSNGPPLSPWHVSCPPFRYPAHISLPSMSVWCVHSGRIGTSTSRMLSATRRVGEGGDEYTKRNENVGLKTKKKVVVTAPGGPRLTVRSVFDGGSPSDGRANRAWERDPVELVVRQADRPDPAVELQTAFQPQHGQVVLHGRSAVPGVDDHVRDRHRLFHRRKRKSP